MECLVMPNLLYWFFYPTFILVTRSNFRDISMEINYLPFFFSANENIYQMILLHTLVKNPNQSLIKKKKMLLEIKFLDTCMT